MAISANNANFGGTVTIDAGDWDYGSTWGWKLAVTLGDGFTNPRSEFIFDTVYTSRTYAWTPALADYGALLSNTRKSGSVTINVHWYKWTRMSMDEPDYEWQFYNIEQTDITLTMTSAQGAPTASSSPFSFNYNNAGTDVAGVAAYVTEHSKVRASFDKSRLTFKYGATGSKWTVKFGSEATTDVGYNTTAKDSGVISTVSTDSGGQYINVTASAVDSRGFSYSVTQKIYFVPYVAPGSITANNANFGSAVSMEYGVTSGSGATYTVTAAVPLTNGTTETATVLSNGTATSASWTPTTANFAPKITDRKSVTCTITVKTYSAGVLFGTKTKAVTLSFAESSFKPTLASGAFAIARNNTGTAVENIAGYVQNYSKIRASYDSSKVTLATGATVAKWSVKIGSAAAVDVAAGTATKDSGVITASGAVSVVCTVTDSRGFTASQSFTATFVSYVVPGTITANNANFGSGVSLSYGVTSGSGATYTVTTSVPQTNGSTKTETLQTTSSASSRTWTPAVETYAPLITDRKSVTATITVKTYSGGILFGTKTKTITLTFTGLEPTLASGAFAISAVNSGAVSGMSGYIQGYSKIRATYNSSKVTLKHSATVSKWSVKFGPAAAADVAAGTSTKDSAVISATTTVVCTVTDSRGFTASQSFTATIIPYSRPSITATAIRADSGGTADDEGTYIKVGFSATYAAIATNQNTISVKVYSKAASAGSYTDKGAVSDGTTTTSGTNKVYARTGKLYSGYTSTTTYNVKIVATDALGNTASLEITVQTATWAFHVRNKGTGAAIGKAAETDKQMQIPSDWKYYRGTNKVFDEGDTIPAGNIGNIDASKITSGTLPVTRGGTGETTKADAANSLINGLSEATAAPTDDTHFVCENVNAGKTTYHRRTMSALWTYIKSKVQAGLTMVGDLIMSNKSIYVKSTNLKDGTAPGSATFGQRVYFYDKDDFNLGYVAPYFTADGKQGLDIVTRRKVNGSDTTQSLLLYISPDGALSVSLSAAPWRSALGLGTSGAFPITVAQGGTGNTSVDTTPTASSTKMVTSGGVKTALDGKVSDTGDTMTGTLEMKNTSIKDGTAVSDESWGTSARFRDSENAIIGQVHPQFMTDGRQGTCLRARRKVNGSNQDFYLSLFQKADGTRSVSLTDAAVWRSALGVANMTAATSSAAGTAGRVPAPAAGKQASFLRGDATWAVPTNTVNDVVIRGVEKSISSGQNGVSITAPTVSGYTFVTWYYVSSMTNTGTLGYIGDPSKATANLWCGYPLNSSGKTTRAEKFQCWALYKK